MKVPSHITERFLQEAENSILIEERSTAIHPVKVYDVDDDTYCLFHNGKICHETDYDEELQNYEYEYREDGCPHCGDVGCQWCSGVDYLM